MSKTSAGVVVCFLGLVGAGWLGLRARQAHDARALSTRASALLEESIAAAPALADLRSTEARKLCAESLTLADDTQTRALEQAAHAVELFARGEQARAKSELTLARHTLGDMPLLLVLDATLAEARGEHELARARISHLVAGSSSAARDPRVLLMAADIARTDGRSDEALSLLQRALSLQPKAAVLYERRGLVHELLADLTSARSDFEAAARMDRNGVAPLLHLGRMLRDSGDPRSAIFAFRSALQRDPRNVDARIGTGVCRNEIGDRVGARMDLEEAEALDPTRVEPQLALGDLDVADAKLEAALLHYRRAVQLDKTNAAGWVKLGNALVRVKAADQAVLAFQAAIKLAPELAQAHNGLGAALLAAGDARAAETELGAAATLDPRDPNPLLNLALLRKQGGDDQGAELALAQAKERDPRLLLASFTGSGGRKASRARRP